MSKQNVQPHGRIIIRKKVKELLVDKVDINRSKMFCSKPGPKFAEELPCLLIYFADEIEDTQKIVPRNYKRNISLYQMFREKILSYYFCLNFKFRVYHSSDFVIFGIPYRQLC